jgi:hypothetical protein
VTLDPTLQAAALLCLNAVESYRLAMKKIMARDPKRAVLFLGSVRIVRDIQEIDQERANREPLVLALELAERAAEARKVVADIEMALAEIN